MTQEDKQLLLADLCARLPYGVICYDEAQNETGIFKQFEYEGFGRIHNGRGMRYIEHIHPILRPMSSMTEEEKEELIKNFWGSHTAKDTFEELSWYLSKHFDINELIPRGLAIEVTEDNNPYKE